MYTYANEIFGNSLRSWFSPVSLVCFGLAGIAVNLVSFRVEHFSFYIYFNLVCIAITVPFLFYLIESPFYLHRKKRVKALYECLLKICHRNHTDSQSILIKSRLQSELRYGKYFEMKSFDDSVNDLPLYHKLEQVGTNVHSDPVTIPRISDLPDQNEEPSSEFKSTLQKRYFLIFLKMVFLFVNIDIILGLSLIINKQLGISDVHVSGLLIVSFKIFGFTAGLWLVPKLGRRAINILSIALYCVYSGSLLVLDLVSNHYIPYFHRSWGVRLGETGKTHQCWRY